MYPINKQKTIRHVDKLHSQLLNSYKLLKSAQAGVDVGPNYRDILRIPLQNKTLSQVVSSVLALSTKSLVLASLSEQFDETISEADITNYLVDFADLAAAVESNASLFLPSINAATKDIEYVTPVAAGIKSAIDTKITSVLSNVTE